ncbi:hypothetical protein [Burkholderia sp. L27(2015)]|uniref:hypothetical protein n=1 Tax=Burkholderia sp. L27(2015) TaxID=1641858 RepID=UPI00131DED77|nr:hypothetical protein [Burkholderia sp. L27(2015)]
MSDSNDDRNDHAHELDHDAEHAAQQEAVARIVREGPRGAIAIAGTAVAVVIGLWFAFYFLVYLPRGFIH